MRAEFLRANHEDLGDLFAAWDPWSAHVDQGALCIPLRTKGSQVGGEMAGAHALIDAGAVLEVCADDH